MPNDTHHCQAEAQATLDRVRAVAAEEWGWNRAVALQRALHDALENPDSEWGKRPEPEEDAPDMRECVCPPDQCNRGPGPKCEGFDADGDRVVTGERVCHEFIDTGRYGHSDAEHDAIADPPSAPVTGETTGAEDVEAAQVVYAAVHDPTDHHCRHNPCGWHPYEQRILPSRTYPAAQLDLNAAPSAGETTDAGKGEVEALLYAHREDALTCYDHPEAYCCVCGAHKVGGYRSHLAAVLNERTER